MPTLLVTNDFPPTVGGIQSYLRDFVDQVVRRVGPAELVVFASAQDVSAAREWDAEVAFTVIRWPHRVMVPTVGVSREMRRIIGEYNIDTVWFGAAAPLALLGASAKSAGVKKVIASTHGHEVGWAMLPGARQVLKKIGRNADVITYISDYTQRRLRGALGGEVEFVALPSGVDKEFFRPATPAERDATRDELGVGQLPLVVCASRLVPRKGQDSLIEALPSILERVPTVKLVIVGTGSYEKALKAKVRKSTSENVSNAVIFTGAVEREYLRDIIAAADVFAMPARTRRAGLDVEGLGIVYLEAQACGIPVVAGNSGGAPETVTSRTGRVVDGRDRTQLVDAVVDLLRDPDRRAEMGREGREHVERNFSWKTLGDRLCELLTSKG